MDVKGTIYGQVSNQIPNQSVEDIFQFSELHKIAFQCYSVQKQGDSVRDWSNDRTGFLNEFIRNGAKENDLPRISIEEQEHTFGHVDRLKSQLFMDAAFKEECINPEMMSCPLPNLNPPALSNTYLQQQAGQSLWSSLSPFYMTMPVLRASPGCYGPNSGYSQYDCFGSANHNLFSTCNIHNSRFFEGAPFNGFIQVPVAQHGNYILSPRIIEQVCKEAVCSPEQISSITTCSDGDGYFDNEPHEGGQSFAFSQYRTESSSQGYQHQDHQGQLNALILGGFTGNDGNVHLGDCSSQSVENMELHCLKSWSLNSQKIPEACDSSSILTFNTPGSNFEHLSKSPIQMLSQQLNQWSCQHIVPLDEQFIAHSSWYPTEEDHGNQKAGKEQPIRAEQKDQGSARLSGPTIGDKLATSRSLSLDELIILYISNYRNLGRNRIDFVNDLHAKICDAQQCDCEQYNVLISHFDNCRYSRCSICGPSCSSCVAGNSSKTFVKPTNDHSRSFCRRDFDNTHSCTEENFQPPLKRLKMENCLTENKSWPMVAPSISQFCTPEQLPCLVQLPEALVFDNAEVRGDKKELPSPEEEPVSNSAIGKGLLDDDFNNSATHSELFIADCKPWEREYTSIDDILNGVGLNSDSVSLLCEEPKTDQNGEDMQVFFEILSEAEGDAPAAADKSGVKSKETKILGVSGADFFTVEQLKEHISSFSPLICQHTLEEVTGQKACSVGESTCQLCGVDKLVFAPAPIFCSFCGAQIKRNLIYYWTLDGNGTRHCFCTKCFRETGSGNIVVQGASFSKKNLKKGKNDEENEESWVQCDKCKFWQHQICALYNAKIDLEGKAEYFCPKCRLIEIENGLHVPSPESAVFGAKDLPSSLLSDFIEQRLFRRLKEEREERAKISGKEICEVPEAVDLVVRVVLSVNRKVKVKQQYLDIFHGENYPTEFPYRSKKIEGVDVCLFGMYVQEFGSECDHPNQRSIYISYLDSVKYFKPRIETTTGEALRTFVYHEIMIGYLDYCKSRGFATCYIWACPPMKGEDYVLYCHPQTQKTPKSDKLRQWYKSMLRKAAKDNVVVDFTNLYDQFFVPSGECKYKITATRLPYFDGGYWSTAAENMSRNIDQESEGKMKKTMSKRTMKAMGHTDFSGEAAKDIFVMQKLGQTILPAKDDFIIVHLQYTCNNCHNLILSGSQWCCNQCKNVQLCARCLGLETKTHTTNSGKKHLLDQVVVNNVPADTEDNDVILANDFFENRLTFLGFCIRNHYQFDTLRRAKHSSMMILHHLHKLTALTVGFTCSNCHKEVSSGQSWHCQICPELIFCDTCYQENGGACHSHKLLQQSAMINNGTKMAQKPIALQEEHTVKDSMHVSQCQASDLDPCPYPKCLEIRMLFNHTRQCNFQVDGGCKRCEEAYLLMHSHSKNCRHAGCRVPQCKELKKCAEMLAAPSKTW